MSAITAPAPAGASAGAPSPDDKHRKPGMSAGKKAMLIVGGTWLAGLIFFIAVFGFKTHKAPEVASGAFTPIQEFKLDTWFSLGPIAFNKGVLYLLMTAAITLGIMLYVARRLKTRPGRLQVAVEWFYQISTSMTRDSLDERLGKRYFPVVMTLFVFIFVTNAISYVPLPVDSLDKFTLLGVHIPSFQIFAADTNVAFPLILSLLVFVLFTYEGLRAHHGPFGLLKSLIPGGMTGAMAGGILGIEILSYFLRLVSLCVRLWANLLAGHILISFLSGELGVLVGAAWVQWFLLPGGIVIYLFELVLIAGLQAFIFAILTAIYIGDTVGGH